MDFLYTNLLTILILLPVFGAVAVVLHQMFWKQERHLKWLTLGITLVNFLISIPLIYGTQTSGFSFEVNKPWIAAINSNYHIA
ncbi:MAG: hypothetical protein PSX80_02695, partial [bacterium]|nr:hypothetical protein [bacterium]